jgi:hypothetical protein
MSGELWPNFFIVGAMKCGTTTLWSHLRSHPDIFFPAMKEPIYFLTKGPRPEHVRVCEEMNCVGNTAKYLRLYEGAEEFKVVGDASPQYLWDKNAPARIYEVSPSARIVVMLRDPVVRAHSHYLMYRRLGGERLSSFYDALKADMADRDNRFFFGRHYIEMGLYCEQIKRYFEVFGRDRVFVLLLDELSKQPEESLARVAQHLEISTCSPQMTRTEEVSNAFKLPRPALRQAWRTAQRILTVERREKYVPGFINEWLRKSKLLYNFDKPVIDPRSRGLLQSIYDPEISNLEQLLNRKLPELRKSWG